MRFLSRCGSGSRTPGCANRETEDIQCACGPGTTEQYQGVFVRCAVSILLMLGIDFGGFVCVQGVADYSPDLCERRVCGWMRYPPFK